MNKKQEIRERLLLRRKNLSSEELNFSEKSTKSIWDRVNSKFTKTNVGFYWPYLGEVSPLLIIQELLDTGSSCFLPVVSKDPSNRNLIFKQFTFEANTYKNKFNINEPCDGVEMDCADLDIIFIPCVGLDSKGYRIGMGMGFYDTTLKEIGSNTKLIALAHDFQKIESCFPEGHDIPVHGAITSSEYLEFYFKNAE